MRRAENDQFTSIHTYRVGNKGKLLEILDSQFAKVGQRAGRLNGKDQLKWTHLSFDGKVLDFGYQQLQESQELLPIADFKDLPSDDDERQPSFEPPISTSLVGQKRLRNQVDD